MKKYFTESCSEGPNNQFFLNLFIQSWAGFIEMIDNDWMEKLKKNRLSMKIKVI